MGEAGEDEAPLPSSRKRSYEEDTAASVQSGRANSAAVLEPETSSHLGWNTFAAFGENGTVMPQSNGAVLGNIDFGALFGLGDSVPPEMNVYSASSASGVLAGVLVLARRATCARVDGVECNAVHPRSSHGALRCAEYSGVTRC